MQKNTKAPIDINVLFNRATIKGADLRHGIEQFAHITASALGLPSVSVEWSAGIPTAAMSSKGRVMLHAVRDDANISNATLLRYAGFVVHELLHWKYTDFNAQTRMGNTRYIAALHNAIEDAWIERSGIKSGLLGNIKNLLRELVNQMVAEAMQAVTDWADPAQYPFALAVYCREFGDRVPVPAALLPVFAEASRRIDTAKNSADTLAIAEWVYSQLQLDHPEQKPGDDQQQGNDQGEGQPGEQGEQADGQPGDGQPADGGDDAAQDGASDAPEGPTGDDQDAGEGEGATGDDRAPDAPADAGKPRKPGRYQDAAPVEPGTEAPKGADVAHGGSFSADHNIEIDGYHLNTSGAAPSVNVPAKLRYELRRLFDNSASTLFSVNRKSGAININALHKFGQSDRLFQQRKDIDGIDSAVVIVLDVSGSMFPHLMPHALNACAALIDALQSADVATAVITFGSRSSLAIPFGTRVQQARKLLGRVGGGGGTNDFAAIKMAHDMLRRRTESRKVCFVLTDGAGKAQAAREQCISGDAFGITTIGVGICTDVRSVYPNAVTVRDASALGEVTFAKIKTVI